MINLKVTPLNLTIAAIVTTTYLGFKYPADYPNEEQENVVTLNTQVNTASMVKLAHEIKDLENKHKTLILKITSPGGSVFAGREVINAIRQSKSVIHTYGDNLFASMGMALFIEGEQRLVTKDAIGLLHRGSSGNASYGQLKAAERELSQTNPNDPRLEEIRSNIVLMDKIFEPEFRLLEKFKLIAPNPNLTQLIIDKLKAGNEDVWLNAQEMIDSGIATKVVDRLPEE